MELVDQVRVWDSHAAAITHTCLLLVNVQVDHVDQLLVDVVVLLCVLEQDCEQRVFGMELVSKLIYQEL